MAIAWEELLNLNHERKEEEEEKETKINSGKRINTAHN